MDEKSIEASTADFPFKKVKQKGSGALAYQQTRQRSGSKDGSALVVEHNGHDHLHLVFRSLYETPSNRQGSQCAYRWQLDTKEAVQLASILFLMAENHMRDSAEEPYTAIVDAERAAFGPNWVYEDYNTAVSRTEKRKERSHLFGLMKRCVETCEDEKFIQFLAFNLSMWAEQSGDEFAMQQAEKAIFQLGMVPEAELN